MANTLGIGAAAKTLCRVATTALQELLIPAKTCFTVLEIEPPDPPALDSVAPLATVAPATNITDRSTNADFETGDCTLAPLSFSHKLYVQPFGLSNSDLEKGARLQWLADLNSRALANSINDAVFALLTTANYGAAIVTKSSAAFALGDFETLAAGVTSPARAVVLDTPYFVKVKPSTWLPQNTAAYETNRWGAAGTNVHGFVATPRAIVVRCGIPMVPKIASPVIARELIELPQLGLVAEASVWTSLPSRSIRAAYSLYFAASVGDSAALKLLTSA